MNICLAVMLFVVCTIALGKYDGTDWIMTCSDIHLSYHPPRSRAARKSFLLYDIQKRSKWKHFYRAETFSLYRKGSFGEPFRYTLCFSLFFRRLLRCWF